MILRPARQHEAEICYQCIEDARAYHASLGFEQWHPDYPTRQTILDDIADHTGYAFEDDTGVIGYCCIIIGDEPAYHEIDGAWKTNRPYAVLHRLSFSRKARGSGLSGEAFRLIKEFCLQNDVDAIRADTQDENKVMQHILDREEFEYCGLVWFGGGRKLAYEWDFRRHFLVPDFGPPGSISFLFAALIEGGAPDVSLSAKCALRQEACQRHFPKIKPDLQREIRSLVSYAVGCMFGRYSLDEPGLIYTGGKLDESRYMIFKPVKDGIIPICEDGESEDDIVSLLETFLTAAYGMNYLEDNLRFIARTLGKEGPPREAVRSYFLNDFYADHLKTYWYRPIYRLIDSGGEKADRKWILRIFT